MSKVEQIALKDMRADLLGFAKYIDRCIDLKMLERADKVLRSAMVVWREEARELIEKYDNLGEV